MILTQDFDIVSHFLHLPDDEILFLQQKDFVCRNHTHQAVDFVIQSGVAVVVPPGFQLRRGVELIQIKKAENMFHFFISGLFYSSHVCCCDIKTANENIVFGNIPRIVV